MSTNGGLVTDANKRQSDSMSYVTGYILPRQEAGRCITMRFRVIFRSILSNLVQRICGKFYHQRVLWYHVANTLIETYIY